MKVVVEEGLTSVLDEAAMAAAPSHRFLRRAWFQAAVTAYGQRKAQTISARQTNGSVAFALPLVSVGPAGIGVNQVPGCYWPFRSFPVADDATVADAVEFLSDRRARRALGPVWRIGPLYESDPVLNLLRAAAGPAGWQPVTRRVATDFVLDLAQARQGGGWPRSSTLKKNRYLEKQLAMRGSIDWCFLQGKDWGEEVMRDLAVIEARSWVGTRTDRTGAKFLHAGHRSFWENAARDPVLGQHIRAALLRVAGQPVAFSLDVDCGSWKFVIANSYDEAFAECSPGKLLAYRSLVEASSRGIESIDWGAGDSGYKQGLGAQEGPQVVDLLLVRGRYAARFVAAVAQQSLAARSKTGPSASASNKAGPRLAGRRIGVEYECYRVFSKTLGSGGDPSVALPSGVKMIEVDAAAVGASRDAEISDCDFYGGADARGFAIVEGDRIVCLQWYWHGGRLLENAFWAFGPHSAGSIQLVTVADRRGRGYATILKRTSATRMHELGFDTLFSRAWWTHHASLQVSAKAGWRRVGTSLSLRLPWREKPTKWRWAARR